MSNGKTIEVGPGVKVRTMVAAVLSLLVAALFDASASGAVEAQEQVTFRGGVDLVTATVSVRDRKGRVIKDSQTGRFRDHRRWRFA